jgi:hypothetical protein
MKQTNCKLCEKEIKNYNPAFNHLVIDECHSVNICPDCITKIGKWQQGIYANLFPTKLAKKRLQNS